MADEEGETLKGAAVHRTTDKGSDLTLSSLSGEQFGTFC